MAQVVRTRRLIATAFAPILAVALSGCGGESKTVATIDAATARSTLAAVVERHHGMLRGTMGTALVELRETESGPATQILFAAPDRIRVRVDGTSDVVVRDGDRVTRHATGAAPAVVDTALRNELIALCDVLELVLLLPLYDAPRCDGGTANELPFATARGEFVLTTTPDGRPQTLKGPRATVRFDEWIETGLTVLPRVVTTEPLGVRHVRILDSGLRLDERTFTDPARSEPVDDRGATPTTPGDDRPRVPTVVPIPAKRYLVLPDDGDWTNRMRAIGDAGLRLHGAGQRPDGLPTWFPLDGAPVIGIPFTATGANEFAPKSSERLHTIAAHDALVVAVGPGEWAALTQSGERRLVHALSAVRRAAGAPLRVIPFVAPGGPPPDATAQKALELRLELPLR